MAARFTPLAMRGGVLLSPGFVPPFGWLHRSIVTVHDLHYLHAATSDPLRMHYFARVVIPLLRRCRLVLTVSDYSAYEIRQALGPKGPEVVNVGCGVDPLLIDVVDAPATHVPQILFVGGDKQNKNLPTALKAAALAQQTQEFDFVVLGEVADSIVQSAPPRTQFLGLVPDAELGSLYAHSAALLMPSLDEGFGLPALESMAAGTPVIYGDRGALPEVVGASGWPVGPTDVDSISSAIMAALDEPIEISEGERVALVENHRWSDVAKALHDAVAGVL
jgi:glycosyltransferase involved in cell wall biosynthesis